MKKNCSECIYIEKQYDQFSGWEFFCTKFPKWEKFYTPEKHYCGYWDDGKILTEKLNEG